jgi:hypothetical protein
MSKFAKTLVLALCAGVSLGAHMLFVTSFMYVEPPLVSPSPGSVPLPDFTNYQPYSPLGELLGFVVIGAIICLIFGTPCLLLIDKYFSRFKSRYMIGGAVAGWVAWFFMVGPLLTPSPWLRWNSWVLDGINHVALYVGLGFGTGLLFTIVLWCACRIKHAVAYRYGQNPGGFQKSN